MVMKLRRLLFSILFLTAWLMAYAEERDSKTYVEKGVMTCVEQDRMTCVNEDTMTYVNGDSVTADTIKSASRYEKRVGRMKNGWNSIVPNLSILQYAGDIGVISLGVGWDYGKRNQWETYLMFGYVPKDHTPSSYITITAKEIYTPWTIRVGKRHGFSPFFATLMINTTLGTEFWTTEPDRYPKGYYGFSSKVRFHIGVGQKFKIFGLQNKSHWFRDLAIYYEVSTCDLYVRQKFLNSYIPLKDVFVLGVGLQYTLF